jgi:hypothetical protein
MARNASSLGYRTEVEAPLRYLLPACGVEREMITLLAALGLPIIIWCVYVAAKRQASLKSIFVLVGAECCLLAILGAIFGQ